eukprot:7468262-Pyramimonas_sp.AAC.1
MGCGDDGDHIVFPVGFWEPRIGFEVLRGRYVPRSTPYIYVDAPPGAGTLETPRKQLRSQTSI